MYRLALILLAFSSVAAQELLQGAKPRFSWTPMAEAIGYNVRLLHEETGEEGLWYLSPEDACRHTDVETGEARCAVDFNIPTGTYQFFISWQRVDGTFSDEFTHGDQTVVVPDGPCHPLNLEMEELTACLEKRYVKR